MNKLRKLDYIIFYIFISGMYIIQSSTISVPFIIVILIICIIPALILGTITNFIFARNKLK